MAIGAAVLIYGGYRAYHYYRDIDRSDKEGRNVNFQKQN